jgi:hypothetical protein
MSSAKTMKFPDKISSDDKLMAPQRLYNDVIDVLEEEGMKWVANCIQSGERTVKVLRDVLWYTTCHHDRFSEAGCRFPDKLKSFLGIMTEKEENESFIKVREIQGQQQNGAQEDKYQQSTTSHKKLNKNIEQQHRPLQKLGELRCFRKVSISCFLYNTHHVVHRQRHVYRIQWFPYKRF